MQPCTAGACHARLTVVFNPNQPLLSKRFPNHTIQKVQVLVRAKRLKRPSHVYRGCVGLSLSNCYRRDRGEPAYLNALLLTANDIL